MDIRNLTKLINGKLINLPKNPNKKIASFKLDSRNVYKDDVFICINTGYLYIEDAIKNGACVIITDKDIHLKTKTCIIYVDNIELTLLRLIEYVRNKYKYVPLIAITGSVGKTTTKELLHHILSSKYKVLKNEGNKNNYIGIADTIFKLDSTYDIVVLEVGMNHTLEIEKISNSIKPDISVITNIGTSHIGNLGSKKNIYKAKMEIVSGMKNGNLVVPYTDSILKHAKYDVVNKCLDIKISKIKINDKLNFVLRYHRKNYMINFDVPNKSYISNIMLAFELSTYFIINIDEVIKSINSFESINSRMKIIDVEKYKIIDDTYNSSYESIKGVIEYINNIPNKLIILGDIKELGIHSIKIHKKINHLLKGINKNNILLVGDMTKYIKGIHFNNNEDIIQYLSKINLNSFTILVKGSRLMHMEEIVEFLKK